MGKKFRTALGVTLFLVIGLALYGLVTDILKPYQTTSIMTDKGASFREEPANTVEVLFLGTSTTADSFVPTRLYEEHGICSYNLGTSAQPMLVSYCLAKEAYERHPTSLSTIVLDCSALRFEVSDGLYRLALDEVSLPNKYDAVMNWEGSDDDKLIYLSPSYAYHSRWSELSDEDWAKPFYGTHRFLRGYEPSDLRVATSGDISKLSLPSLVCDPTAEPTVLMEDELEYFDDLVEFCEPRGISLVLTKTPVYDMWSDSDHNAIQAVADARGLPFLDLNYEPFFSETGYNQSLDTRDLSHPNNDGAAKITDYIGSYLVENGMGTDVRGDPAFAFMDEQVETFDRMTGDLGGLKDITDPVDYLAEAMKDPDYTVFLGAGWSAADQLNAGQRQRLRDLGFDWLAAIDDDSWYRAVVKDGRVVNEDHSDRADTRLFTNYTIDDYVLPRSAFFQMFKSSDEEAIEALAYQTDPEDREQPEWIFADPGLTVIVYDDEMGTVVDYACFRAISGFRRYFDPQAALDDYLARGAQDDELPFLLLQLKLYDERLATELTAFHNPPMVIEAPAVEVADVDARDGSEDGEYPDEGYYEEGLYEEDDE